MSALRKWAEQLAAWAVPSEIAAAVPDPPWVLPRRVFERRADAQIAAPLGATFAEAAAVLAEPGTVLDVGVAAGATSLSLVGRAGVTAVCGVDGDGQLLASFAARASRLGVAHEAVLGHWPDVAGQVADADLVLCGNVIYNVPDLPPFIEALTRRARRRVVLETAAAHPLTELNELWTRFHGVQRPAGPTADDFLAVLAELGIDARVTRWRRPGEAEHETFAELVDVTRRRLCLPLTRSDEVADALLELGVDPALPPDLGSSGRELVTVSWS
ncbi:class I SAM-dependent methyltransferase [Amycolatopsis rhabdoformis]|uniref:Class I SAM-dependent methyltransferase n=1 Tax=Amycolatopsis rhabdoformis TaxID=1448059 RepID=A0ABZ1HWW2_9PSEU|nr:class I SAM-dependent methyltransferase [Amycolatopsis rhabdoformis]WSE26021.1 class I SAM-dependent methyltransferase [Amycolatopsis rhabdoformis]